MASELKPCEIADALEKCDWAGASIGNKAIVSLAIEALRNTRPAPAATDTGLETVGYGNRVLIGLLAEGVATHASLCWTQSNEFSEPVCLRSQAVELLAAETKLKQYWKDEAERFRIEFEKAAYKYLLAKARAEKSEADNAAKDALIVQLRAASASDFDTMLSLNSRIDDLLATLAEVERD